MISNYPYIPSSGAHPGLGDSGVGMTAKRKSTCEVIAPAMAEVAGNRSFPKAMPNTRQTESAANTEVTVVRVSEVFDFEKRPMSEFPAWFAEIKKNIADELAARQAEMDRLRRPSMTWEEYNRRVDTPDPVLGF